LVVLLAAAVVFLAGREAERRLAGRALRNFRVRFSATREAMAARSRGQLELFRARRERAELEAEKARGFHQLGQAVFDDDEAGIRGARTALDGIVERIGRKEAEIEMLMRETEERVQRAQAQASPTQRLEAPPEPPRIPEPWPPPDEGTPPTPEPVPEPTPDPVPEPSPDEAAEPQTRGRKK
jgi:hypothetical protein